jgi:hypothetical protein
VALFYLADLTVDDVAAELGGRFQRLGHHYPPAQPGLKPGMLDLVVTPLWLQSHLTLAFKPRAGVIDCGRAARRRGTRPCRR